MDFLGIGPAELIVILLVIILVIGPKDIGKTARSIGRFLNRVYKSDEWRTVTEASRTIRTLPNRLAREAELEELQEIKDTFEDAKKDLVDAKDEIEESTKELKEGQEEVIQEVKSIDNEMKAWVAPASSELEEAKKDLVDAKDEIDETTKELKKDQEEMIQELKSIDNETKSRIAPASSKSEVTESKPAPLPEPSSTDQKQPDQKSNDEIGDSAD